MLLPDDYEQIKQRLEKLLDEDFKGDLPFLVEILAEVCGDKADHIQANYTPALASTDAHAAMWDECADNLQQLWPLLPNPAE